MIYQEIEKKVFDWMYSQYELDNTFTFSVRKKTSKGAESDYFIGTKKYNYFGTTFWSIPVGYAGSASDLINLFFNIKEGKVKFKFQLIQIKEAHDIQNDLALKFIRVLYNVLKEKYPQIVKNADNNKQEKYEIEFQETYDDIEILLNTNKQIIYDFIKIVTEELKKFISQNKNFIGYRISKEEFLTSIEKMKKRQAVGFSDIASDSDEREMSENLNKPFIHSNPLNQILFGPPGTGKTFNSISKALELINDNDVRNLDWSNRKAVKDLYDEKVKEGQIVFTTFHQSMSYEDFIEGIKPLKPEVNDKMVTYDVVNGIFKNLCRKAEIPVNLSFESAYNKLLADLELNDEIEVKNNKISFTIKSDDNGNFLKVVSDSNIKTISKEGLGYVSKSKRFLGMWGRYYKALFELLEKKYGYLESASTENRNYVLIIDEINRGNVSAIFGELITLIEEDKRLGRTEALEVTLPYSKEKFGVPPNLYIVGTMNTADRSVEALDSALRRRFSFEEIAPEYELKELQYEYAGIKIPEMLQRINERIEKLLDKDHQIGHSYFILKEGESVEDKLLDTFYKKIIPLLQEYFYGDFGKIGLVLGKGFVSKKEWENQNHGFASFDYLSSSDYDEREVFQIIDYRNGKNQVIRQGNNDEMTMDFPKALQFLMN
jgi:5-methylcytosine-specific restriction protein B